MDDLAALLGDLWPTVLALAPKAALVLAVLVIGIITALVGGGLVRWLTRKAGLEALAEKAGIAKLLYAVGFKKGLSHFLGRLAFWSLLLLTFSAVAELLGLPGVASFTGVLMGFLPRLLAAGLVLLLGFWFANLVRQLVLRMGQANEQLQSPKLLAKIAHYAILALSVTLAADQAGIDTELVAVLIAVTLGGAVFAVALAFGLGARTMFASIVARHHYQGILLPGDEVTVADDTGTVIRYTSVALVIQTADGEKIIPCHRLLTTTVERTSPPEA